MTERTVLPAVPPMPPAAATRQGAAAAASIVTVVLAVAALAAGCRLAPVGTVAAVAVAQAALITTWVAGFGVPGRIGVLVVGVAAAAGADSVLVRWNSTGYQPVLAVLGLALPVMFAHQLVRGVTRARVVESLADAAVLLLGVTSVAGLIVLRYQDDGRELATAVVAAAGVGLLVDLLTDLGLPMLRFDPAIPRGLPGVVLGVVAGGATADVVLRQVNDLSAGRAIVVGAGTALVACLISVGTSFAGASTFSAALPSGPRALPDDATVAGQPGQWPGVPRVRPVASVLLTLALTTPAGYVLATSLTG